MSEKGVISCANKNTNANFKFQGIGDIDIKSRFGDNIELKDVIYAKDLAKNLLSLRKFVDQGLKVYLDNKCINIYDPVARKNIISGLYNKPFWEIELKFNSPKSSCHNSKRNKKILVNLVTRSGKVVERKVENANSVKSGTKDKPRTKNLFLNTVNNRKVENSENIVVKNVEGSIQL